MQIYHATAKIKVDHPGAKPNFAEGRKALTFHLTRGHFLEGDTETFNDAINFIGTVQAATTPSEFKTWRFCFLQFQKVDELGMFYAGPKRRSGQISLFISKPPALTTSLHLDSEDEFSPWTHAFDGTLSGGKITAISGDHPAARAPKHMTNSVTNALKFLFHIVDVRRFWTVFSAQDPAGDFHHLAHVEWKLRYDFMFVWRNGSPKVHQNRSLLSASQSVSGAPTEEGLNALLKNPKPPHANAEVRKAIKHAVLHGPPNRSDLGERKFVNLPRNFFS
jgi:hypothetical protein